jgi:transcriptional regulator EpsA
MGLLPSLSAGELQHYHHTVSHSVEVRSHFDALVWLQGDMQRYLPHDILIASWGDFSAGEVQHDILSPIPGVRSINSNPLTITPLLVSLFSRWTEFDRKPFAFNTGETGFLLQDTGLQCALGAALQQMRSAMVHGIFDERGSHDCLYVAFSRDERRSDLDRNAMAMVLPYVDIALRQVEHLPHQTQNQVDSKSPEMARLLQEHDLTERELEVLQWVALGKTNPEIGTILDISEFTVKNHMQRVFKKLDVTNRAQAVGKFQTLTAAHV